MAHHQASRGGGEIATTTIAAIATPPGQGGIGVVRISGPTARQIAIQLTGITPRPRYAHLAEFRTAQGAVIDQGLMLYFRGPASFTGEDVVELQGHGGPMVMDLLMAEVLAQGAQPARPGEFSERAYLNDKIDLVQAEAIADLIEAATTQAARLATRTLSGAFSEAIADLQAALTRLRVHVEAAIDFPEEEIDFLADQAIVRQLDAVQEQLSKVLHQAEQGTLLREGVRLVLIGEPNAGKSSLLNRLCGRERAIVTEIPGTTRDTLHEQLNLDGIPITLVDTAGLRVSDDPVELEGIRRAEAELQTADHVLWVRDASKPEEPVLRALPGNVPVTRVDNKIDLTDRSPGQGGEGTIAVSAKFGQGMDELREQLKKAFGFQQGDGVFMARRRHLDALQSAADHVRAGRDQLEQQRSGELLAEELRLAQQQLSMITGEFSSDDLLGEIFSSFCIGK